MWQCGLELALGGLGILVVHELGHLLVARAFGVNAATVAIGVGPTVARFTDRHGTCWTLGLLPFVSNCGFPDGPVPQAASPGQPDGLRSIRSLSLGQRAIIILAGPLSNAIMAGALFLAAYIQDKNFSPARIGKIDATLTFLIGGFSLAVALFNLLPVFPLDGGQLTLLAFETLTGGEISRERASRLSALGLVVMSIASALSVLSLIAAASWRHG